MMGITADATTAHFEARGELNRVRPVQVPPPPEFCAVFEAMPGLTLVLEPDVPRYTVVAVSNGYARMLGLEREAILGRPLFTVLPIAHGDTSDASDDIGMRGLAAALDRMVETREAEEQHHDLGDPTTTGDTRWWSTTSAPVLGPGGEVAHIVMRLDDVTELVGFGRAALVVQRQLQGREGALHQALDAAAAAEAASAAKTEMLMVLSHELRTPLQAILGFAQLIEYDHTAPLDDHHRERLRRIVRSGQYLHRLVEDALDLSRIDARHVTINATPLDLSSVVGEVVATLGPIAQHAGIALAPPVIPADVPRLFADHTRVVQILINLGTNAIKYGRPNGHVELRVAADGARLRIAMIDDGVGVPADQQARVFEPFQRAGREHSGIEGTGIGLTICKQLISLMGGEIGFTSELGRGSEFWIALPAAR
jgi:signal transduction histidine kinase